ncbi:MAG: sodium-dependent bicarbonate transport family permease [Deltaproteobacteria bacterium]|nr:MAG: sodium-dependent bicarbonate transport family permease [Deltaproteobacteria bacterium]
MSNLLDPTVLCFVVGLIAGLAKSDLKLPKSSYEFVSLYLLLAIGLKGGVQLGKTDFATFLPALLGTIALGLVIPVIAFKILIWTKKFSRVDAGSIAAHYGSVSAVTFATAISYLETQNISYESYVTTLMVILEAPAIIVGIYLAKGGFKAVDDRKELMRDILFGKSLFLLGGGLVIGYVASEAKMKQLDPLFVDLFKGFLALFLLEMGVKTSQQMSLLKKTGMCLVLFAIGMPLISGTLGIGVGKLIGMSDGGVLILTILAASASYIAAPSAMKIAVPQASPTLSLTASLAITFPFNIIVGIPLFLKIIQSI